MWFGQPGFCSTDCYSTVKKTLSKADIRALMEQEVNDFMSSGGEVKEIPRGISGQDAAAPATPHTRSLFLEPSAKRTHVPEVIAAIEARRKKKPVHTPNPGPRKQARRKRKTIYDDFGEPVRKVWVEE